MIVRWSYYHTGKCYALPVTKFKDLTFDKRIGRTRFSVTGIKLTVICISSTYMQSYYIYTRGNERKLHRDIMSF